MTPETAPIAEPVRQFLRHTVATLAYRAEKVLRDVPEGFAAYRPAPASRTPLETLAHMGDLAEWAERFARGQRRWVAAPPATTWETARDRFFRGLAALDLALAETPPASYPAEVIFQGPLADALTHVGQIALMRGMVGSPVRPESYVRAPIEVGRVGADQSAARTEFEGDASAPPARS